LSKASEAPGCPSGSYSFPMVVRRRRGKYFAYIPELWLKAGGNTPADAVLALETKQALLRPELSRFGPQPGFFTLGGAALPILSRALLFLVKGSIVALLALVIAAYAQRAYENRISALQKLGGPAFWSGLESDLLRAADTPSDVPQAIEDEILVNLHVVVQRWRPYIREAQRVLSDAPERHWLHP
jgi:hypothetical protein